MRFAKTNRAAENKISLKGIIEVISGAPTSLQGYGIDKTRLPYKFYVLGQIP